LRWSHLRLVVCAGGSSSVKPLVSIVAHGCPALVAFAGQAGFRAGGRIAEVRDMGLPVLVSVDTAGGSEESSVVIAAAVGCLVGGCSTASGTCCGCSWGTPAEQGLAR